MIDDWWFWWFWWLMILMIDDWWFWWLMIDDWWLMVDDWWLWLEVKKIIILCLDMLRCVLHTEGRRLELHPQIWLKSGRQAQIPLSEADLVHQMVLALIYITFLLFFCQIYKENHNIWRLIPKNFRLRRFFVWIFIIKSNYYRKKSPRSGEIFWRKKSYLQ